MNGFLFSPFSMRVSSNELRQVWQQCEPETLPLKGDIKCILKTFKDVLEKKTNFFCWFEIEKKSFVEKIPWQTFLTLSPLQFVALLETQFLNKCSTKLKTNLKEVRNKFETLYFEGRMNSLQLLRSKY